MTEQCSAMTAHVSRATGNQEWYTPPRILQAAREAFGIEIELDPCSCDKAQETVRANRFFTAADDALKQAWWSTALFMNPPYSSKLCAQMISKLLEHISAGDVTRAIVFTNNCTETKWGQALLRRSDAVCFPGKRIKFLDDFGEPRLTPLQGQMICYLEASWVRGCSRFEEAFREIGATIRRR